MKNIQLFNVAPSIPEKIRFLETLAHNLWWCWNPDAVSLFRRIDPDLWSQCRHNPLRFFGRLSHERLMTMAEDRGFITHLEEVEEAFGREVKLTASGELSQPARNGVAYFSLEFGIHESLRLYSGGLGCLAGDHLKSASDLDIPLVGMGLLYRQGYFQQYLDDDGWQREVYPEIEMHCQPFRKVCGSENKPLVITVPLPDGPLHAEVWRVDIGRIPLFLLNANIPSNSPAMRSVTGQLYGGDQHMRIRQELLLGIGGVRALLAMGYDPRVCHLNEGHAAFLGLGRIAHLTQTRGIDADAAFEILARSSVFTTHTPVPAGNETFPVDMLKPYLAALEPETGIAPDQVIRWGQAADADPKSEVSMTILGLRFAHRCNAVSALHGEVSRSMWSHLWPQRPHSESPIDHITNGVHVASWLSAENAHLFDRYLGTGWRNRPGDPKVLESIERIPNEELWRIHEAGRNRLIRAARELGERQFSVRNASRKQLDQLRSIFDHNALTIGFARRFASYKRAALLLRDPERLTELLNNEKRPVQFVFAGKAHPADDGGKGLIRQIVNYANQSAARHKILFIEDYDIQVARYMVQGVDVWLNNPRRPHEASGTSGMKAALNGGLHCSILDGWWVEGFTPDTGWAIGDGEEHGSAEYQDQVEGHALYNVLENSVIPLFYERDRSGVPTRWVEMMKASMRMSLGFFTTHRMLEDYMGKLYQPSMADFDRLTADDHAAARDLVRQRKRFDTLWSGIALELPVADRDLEQLHVGDTFTVTTRVTLGKLKPDEIVVQAYCGQADSHNEIVSSEAEEMELANDLGNGTFEYRRVLTCRGAGRYGLTARVVPRDRSWDSAIPGFTTWANGA